MIRRLLGSSLCCLTLLLPAGAQGFDLFGPPGIGLARLADADGSGDVSAAEREAFLASFQPDGSGALDRGVVLARCVVGGLDVDGDGAITGDDVHEALSSLDTDGDGAISATEAEPVNGASATGFGAARWLMAGIAFSMADEDLSRDVTVSEWKAFGATAPTGQVVELAQLAGWTVVAQRNVPEVRSAFTPSILLATLGASLDADRNGSISRGDLDSLMGALDADGNGELSSGELRPRRGGMSRRGWEISDEVASRTPGMPWQRTLEDALEMVRRTNKPLLIAVNMDGEPASDNLRAGRYRDPAFIELASGFVCVVASPDTHVERSHDDRGSRVVCDQLGRVIESEHIDIEPALFERYFSGQRVAPRHVGVSPDGEILFDLFLLNDFTVIDAALREHGVFEGAGPDYGAMSSMALLESPDAGARDVLEARMTLAEETERVGLAALALDSRRQTQHPELVRLGLRDASEAVRRVTIDGVVREIDGVPLDLMPEIFSVAGPDARVQLSEALASRAGRETGEPEQVRARRLARVFGAAAAPSSVDVERLRAAIAGGAGATGPAATGTSRARLEALARLESLLDRSPEDADLHALRAQTLLAEARHLIRSGSGNPTFFLEDARAGASRALELHPDHALAAATLSGACWYLSDPAGSGDAAARAIPGLVGHAASQLMADTLDFLHLARTRQLYDAMGNEPEWPAEWVGQAIAAHDVLLAHPLGTEAQALAGLQLLGNLELFAEQRAFAERIVERYPASAEAHNWFRFVFLRDEGAAGLARAYDGVSYPAEQEATGLWFAGYGRLVAGDRHVLEGRGAQAAVTYEGAVSDLVTSVDLEPSFEGSAAPYLGFSFAGLCRVRLDAGDLEGALEALASAMELNPGGAEAVGGLGESPAALATELGAAFFERGDRDAARRAEELLEGAGSGR